MRGLRMIWAAIAGFMIDAYILSPLVVFGLSWWLAGIESYSDLNFSNPIHILVGLVLPVLMTVIGGAVAGMMAPEDPAHAGALVGGLGLLTMALDGLSGFGANALAAIISQCVAVVLAALVASKAAQRRRRQA